MKRIFGHLEDGSTVHAVRLQGESGPAAEILTYGGTLHRLRYTERDLVLGFARLQDYVDDRSYQGVIAGRFANRIAGAQFRLGETLHRVSANEGDNHLHGGPMPALQLYGGQGLARQHPGLGDGVCLEPQGYPDAPNRPEFPSVSLEPGQRCRHPIEYRLDLAPRS